MHVVWDPDTGASSCNDLQKLYQQHQGSTEDLLSLEWLRDAPDEEARNYLMAIGGLGAKSVGCIMLLTLGKREFPVDTNVRTVSDVSMH